MNHIATIPANELAASMAETIRDEAATLIALLRQGGASSPAAAVSGLTAYTPGPWDYDLDFIVAPDPSGCHPDIYIAEIAHSDDEGRIAPPEQHDANRRLIAAAPSLHETLDHIALVLADFKPDMLKQLGLDIALEKALAALQSAACDTQQPTEGE